ncbi:MAG: CTP synthase [Planctomycetes bacterium]|jgi:CTP synthase|nr:CTP synthase [Planctomycetota bacterium]
MPKYIFTTGGVVSSLGKGLTSASIGLLLEARGLKVAMQKLDPYINVDPGTMNPFQHGEVYVTADGAETDLDLGHYERFTHATINRHSNYTTGQIYNEVIRKERRGDYLGACIQVVPHITNHIKSCIERVNGRVDVVITEIGGTVGDIEGLPFLEAIRQMGLEKGRGNTMFVHLTLIPYLRASGEVKTKPTQHSVAKLREIGVLPDALICRTTVPLSRDHREKISLFCNVPPEAVIEEKDVDHSIYEVPIILRKEGLDDLIVRHLGLEAGGVPDLSAWERMLDIVIRPDGEVEIAVVGKYMALHDAYKSVYEALAHGGIANRVRVKFRKVSSQDVEEKGAESLLSGVHGILVPGGFGIRGIEGKVAAIRHAREKGIPFFGICLGMQCASIEAARNLAGLPDAHSTEFAKDTPHPIISLLEEQRTVRDMGGTMRLGNYSCHVLVGSAARRAYGAEVVHERHRHRFEFNNEYRDRLEQHGFVATGINEDHDLVEIVEYRDHPWFVGVQFHPEFRSKPTAPHPLFRDFIAAAVARAGGEASK